MPDTLDQAALDAGAPDPLVRPAHTLKGASASIGARAVEALARAIEDRARAGAMDEIPGMLTELEAAYEEGRGDIDAPGATCPTTTTAEKWPRGRCSQSCPTITSSSHSTATGT